MTGSVTRIGLEIEPLDPLFFRRGRPFGAGSAAVTGMPLPQTLAGALRTMLLRQAGCDFDRLRGAIVAGQSFRDACDAQGGGVAAVGRMALRGPWLASSGKPVVPAPYALARDRETGRLLRLDPLRSSLPGWVGMQAGMLPLWPRRDQGRRHQQVDRLDEAFLTLDGLKAYLAGDVPAADDVIQSGNLYELDFRTGIAVDGGSGTAAEGLIYGVGYLALRPGVTFHAELQAADGWVASLFGSPQVLPFGGEGRRAHVVKRPATEWPSAPPHGGDGTVLVLTTPAPFSEGWKPPTVAPIAAAVGGPVALSGWDLARGGPKPTRFAVEAGSVYFLTGADAAAGGTTGSLCEGDDEQAGWGAFVRGVWNYA